MRPTTHTPGPWSVSNGNLLRIARADGSGGAVTICGVHRIGRLSTGEQTETVLANASLIASAPDLLDALIASFYDMVGIGLAHSTANNGWQWPDDAPQTVSITAEKARAAIAKATGADQ